MSSRILVIDDDASALDIVNTIFEGRGFEVIRHCDGVSALSELGSSRPDVIIIDLMMPAMTGQACVREMRNRGVTVPIVAFTALDDPQAHQEAEQAGCTKVIVKPCKFNDLVCQIEALVFKKEQTA